MTRTCVAVKGLLVLFIKPIAENTNNAFLKMKELTHVEDIFIETVRVYFVALYKNSVLSRRILPVLNVYACKNIC